MVQKIDVSNELRKIQDAVYGEEVRSSIHDGIKKVADTTNIIIEEWSDVNDTMNSLKNNLEASEIQRLTNEETRESQETKRQQDTSKAIQEVNAVKNTVEQKLNDGEFIGASGVWLGDSVPSADYDVWVKPTVVEGISGLFIRNQELWYEITSIKGEKGSIPKHEVNDKKIRFENSDGSWGNWVDLSLVNSGNILTSSGKSIQEELETLASRIKSASSLLTGKFPDGEKNIVLNIPSNFTGAVPTSCFVKHPQGGHWVGTGSLQMNGSRTTVSYNVDAFYAGQEFIVKIEKDVY